MGKQKMKILVLFKTHLDIGFTDFSGQVVRKYNEIYIPQAISVAEEIARSGRPEGFVWTTGSWLIDQYLRTAAPDDKARMVRALENHWLSWHGLPCTMHSECANGALYDYGLSRSAELDRRFGRTTIGAKYTDVPGHTVAIVPHLARYGIRFLHIGINPASAAVDVPLFFRWRYGESEIVVMYNGGDYGEFTMIPGTDTAICFAHTGDNLGPQSAAEILRVYDRLHAEYPDAEICAADLNDAAAAVLKTADTLPVITDELGDTWIHGLGTDPQKLSQYRALLRMADTLPVQAREAMFAHLLLVPEHTWGLDEKKHLHENRNYCRPLFDRVRNNFNYKKMELSWAEQRRYVQDAVNALPANEQPRAYAALNEFTAPRPSFDPADRTDERTFSIHGWTVTVGESGAVIGLEKDGQVYADHAHPLCAFSYDEYNADEVWAFEQAYLKPKFIADRIETGIPNWATEDFGKENLDREVTQHTAWAPESATVYRIGDRIAIEMTADADMVHLHGCPPQLVLWIVPQSDDVRFDFQWFDKPANRAPEALWLRFACLTKLRTVSKLGFPVDPTTVRQNGNRGMHGTDGMLTFDTCTLETLDAPLVSVGGKHIYDFPAELPDSGEVEINLFNNQWGTNFPMWNDGAARFRFILRPQNSPQKSRPD